MQIEVRQKITPRYWLEINLEAIRENIKNLKGLLKQNVGIIAVVKCNAYGHGLIEVTKAIENEVDILAVSGVEEAIALREQGIEIPILFLSNPINEEDLEIIFYYNILPTVNSLKFLNIYEEYANKLSRILDIHLKIDTGMSRMGIDWTSAVQLQEMISSLRHLRVKGIFTHFAHAENPEFTRLQLQRFQNVVDILKRAGYEFLIHAANSSAVLRYSTAWFDCVRPGLIIYGVYPELEVKNRIKLKQAMSFKTRLLEMKQIKRGSFVGYCCTYKATSDMRIGIIPVGYSQGLAWSLSNKGVVLIRGKRVSIIGRVSMDQSILDLRDIENPKIGEEVVITGKQGEEELRIEEIAEQSGTIPYEILCSFGKINNKIYIRSI